MTCVIIGASHGGVNCAFNLRKEGWEGAIILYDADSHLPYHRPPLSKTFLTSDDAIEKHSLKAAESYDKAGIALRLGEKVATIDREAKTITTASGTSQPYDKLVLATGARPFVPPIAGLAQAANVHVLRTAEGVLGIREALKAKPRQAVIIGGGYIGLEIAASLRKLGLDVTVLEREARLLPRVTSPEMSTFFAELHAANGTTIACSKNVSKITTDAVHCADGSTYAADLIIVGVGIRVNTELATAAGLKTTNGIVVNEQTQTNDPDVYALGDCTLHHSKHYNRPVRLESVQNAVDQAKVTAASICGKEACYDSIPWFWSDQYDAKLQMVGLSEGYTQVILRDEPGEGLKKSAWYFKGDELLAVDAVNNAKAYVLGTKFIKDRISVNKENLANTELPLKPGNLV
ncbi:3-phenylpropionate/trans-cinnamate dioxygenase ferredoxin reductase subunit [Marinoscillum furvescens DSM 4134]|uniref:3-phenylpropionate/trans-cinnamate dioxygenase ferredoxin reductase subunit n=2 Tax=Marinoscillum furvescens TaxID=1026 RepID=A0A3D9L649_MARFU|nr:3-phenylpropionate/trans-cinnamate dioxygenase ferredoxin reductase subunit [Marinoscillum furvescens DSM 4134]